MKHSAIAVAPRVSKITASIMAGIIFSIAAFPYAVNRAILIAPLDQALIYLSTHGPLLQKEIAWRIGTRVPGSSWYRHSEEIKLANKLRGQTRFPEAIAHQLKALEISDRYFSSIPETTLWDLEELAWLYEDYGQFAEAEIYFKRALQSSNEKLGLNCFHTERNNTALAYLCRRQGRFIEAEYYCKQRILTDQPTVDFAWKNLACVYAQQQRFDKAEKILKKPDLALPISEHAQSLARLYKVQGRLAEAESTLHQEVKKESIFCTWIKKELAEIYVAKGKIKEAEQLLKQYDDELRTSSRHSGHLMTGSRCLANVYSLQGRYKEAETFLKAANKEELKRFDVTPLTQADGFDDLGLLYMKEKRFYDAETQFLKASTIRLKLLHAKHPSVGVSYKYLADVFKAQGHQPLSEACLQESMKCYKDIPDIF